MTKNIYEIESTHTGRNVTHRVELVRDKPDAMPDNLEAVTKLINTARIYGSTLMVRWYDGFFPVEKWVFSRIPQGYEDENPTNKEIFAVLEKYWRDQ